MKDISLSLRCLENKFEGFFGYFLILSFVSKHKKQTANERVIKEKKMIAQVLHLLTGLCLLGSLFLSVISVASHTWVEQKVENNTHTYHIGLWKYCNLKQCIMVRNVGLVTEGGLCGE